MVGGRDRVDARGGPRLDSPATVYLRANRGVVAARLVRDVRWPGVGVFESEPVRLPSRLDSSARVVELELPDLGENPRARVREALRSRVRDLAGVALRVAPHRTTSAGATDEVVRCALVEARVGALVLVRPARPDLFARSARTRNLLDSLPVEGEHAVEREDED